MQPFKLDELQLHGFRAGSGDEIVVALHGWLDNCHSFLPMLSDKALAQTWYCIDFPGHGLSAWRSKDAEYYFVDYIDDVYQLIQSLGAEKVHLVGHSMGAMVAGLFASCFPEQVKSVSFIEGIATITTPSEQVVEQLTKAIVSRHRNSAKSQRVYKSKELIYQARSLSSELSAEHIRLLMDRNIKSVPQGYTLTTDPKLKNHSALRFNEAQCIAAIKKISAPSQLILGQQGYPFVKQNLNRYISYYNNLKVINLAGGHHCHMQSSELCYEHVQAFIVQNSVA